MHRLQVWPNKPHRMNINNKCGTQCLTGYTQITSVALSASQDKNYKCDTRCLTGYTNYKCGTTCLTRKTQTTSVAQSTSKDINQT